MVRNPFGFPYDLRMLAGTTSIKHASHVVS